MADQTDSRAGARPLRRAGSTPLVTDDGVRLVYAEYGDPDGRPVVLLAGFTAAATSWRYQIRPLTAAGYRVIALDVRGHGASDHPDTGVDMARRGRDLQEVMETLDLTDAVVIGASMGGNTVWSFLDRFGAARVAAVVIVDQTPKMLNTPDWPHGFYGYDESNVDTFFATGVPDTGVGTPLLRRGLRLVRMLRLLRSAGRGDLTPGQLALLHDHATRDWRPVIARTTLPVLFVAGAESELWPSSHARAAAALAPRGESAVILEDGHGANIEQPAAFNRGVLAFLSRVAPAR
ncbi:alpha/beta fold hydrolase [Microbacterium sp. 179-I 3D4 NHS]|uniref:alpha/beta fold hydrolase n=1 Tax=Microbacterium sp. 179-I 3D4 NHS TaxID=3142381 RepID=UPI0039A3CF6D